jgi:hypothetical protein
MVSPRTGKVAGTISMVTVVPIGQVSGGVQPDTFKVIVPWGPAPHTIVTESLVAVGGVKKEPPVIAQV